MTSAFISYSRHDRAVADFVADHLRNRGVDVFIDYQRLRSGNFVEQLGTQIEERDYFIVLISPAAVEESKWVKAEVTWAFSEKDTDCIIPIRYKPAKLTKLFVLASLELVDFSNWHVDRNMEEPIRKLCRLMSVEYEPIETARVEEPLLGGSDAHAEEERNANLNEEDPPQFAKRDVEKLIQSAAGIQDSQPEHALFLYQQVLEIDPRSVDESTRDFIARQEERIRPVRLARLRQQIAVAKSRAQWQNARQLASTILDIDPDDTFARAELRTIDTNTECESTYNRARNAKSDGNTPALRVFMRDIREACPQFGDPDKLLKDLPITRDLLGYVRCQRTLEGSAGSIRKVAFSHSGELLATAHSRGVVKVWSTATGDPVTELDKHADTVNSVSFSPDDTYLASASSDGKIILWDCSNWTCTKIEKFAGKRYDCVFVPSSNRLVSAGNTDHLSILDVPTLSVTDRINVRNLPSHQSVESAMLLTRVSKDRTAFVRQLSMSSKGLLTFAVRETVITRETSRTTFPPVTTVKARESQSTIEVWDTNDWDKRAIQYPTESEEIHKVAVSTDGGRLAYLMDDLVICTMPRGRSQQTIGVFEEVFDFAFSSLDSSLLLVADDNSTSCQLTFYDLDSKKRIKSIDAHEDTINSIAMSPCGRFIATGSDDGTAKIWQL